MHKIFQFLVSCNALDLNNEKMLWPIQIYQFQRIVTLWATLLLIYVNFLKKLSTRLTVFLSIFLLDKVMNEK